MRYPVCGISCQGVPFPVLTMGEESWVNGGMGWGVPFPVLTMGEESWVNGGMGWGVPFPGPDQGDGTVGTLC